MEMTGEELDREMRRILLGANYTNIVSSIAAMRKLGFGVKASYDMVNKVIRENPALRPGSCNSVIGGQNESVTPQRPRRE